MRKKITYIIRHPFISGTAVVFGAGFVSNVINYFFNLAMGRFLTKDEYGLMYSLMSLLGLFSVFSSTLSGVYTKYSAKYQASGDDESISGMFWAGLKLQLIIGVILLIFIVVFSPLIGRFLHVDSNILVYLLGVYLFFSILYTLPTAILQGQLRIFLFSLGTVLGPLVKLVLGVISVILGYSLYGVMGALIASVFIPFLIFLGIFLSHFKNKNRSVSVKSFVNELKNYSLGFFLASFGFSFFTFADVLIIRHFVPEISGQYAALSIMGKAIFYFISPVYLVFFPVIAQKKEKKEKLLGTLLLACFVIMTASVGISFIYFVFPKFVINVFFPKPEYQMLVHYLGIYSLYIMILSFASLFHFFFLSVGRTNIYKMIMLASTVLVFGLIFFHSSLYRVIGVLFFSTFLLLACYVGYYFKYERD